MANYWQYNAASNIINHPHGGTWGDGGTTDYAQIGATGVVNFRGAAGLVLGSCYGNEIGWSQAAAVQNTWYNISDADIADGILRSVTHDGSGLLTVTEPGIYYISYSLVFECDTQSKHVEAGIEISSSGSADVKGRSHIEIANVEALANTQWCVAAMNYYDLADNATIEVAIRTTDTGTPALAVDHINLTCLQVAGT